MTADMTYMHLLHNIAHATNSSLKLDDTLQAILSAVQETLGVRGVIVRLLNPDADALEVAASRGVGQSLLAALQTKIVPGSINAQVMAGETVEIADLGETLRSGPGLLTSAPAVGAYGREDLGGLLAVPLMVRGRVIGSLSLYCAEGCGFSETVVTILLAAADLAAIAIENARLHTALFRIAQALTSTLELQPLLKQVSGRDGYGNGAEGCLGAPTRPAWEAAGAGGSAWPERALPRQRQCGGQQESA